MFFFYLLARGYLLQIISFHNIKSEDTLKLDIFYINSFIEKTGCVSVCLYDLYIVILYRKVTHRSRERFLTILDMVPTPSQTKERKNYPTPYFLVFIFKNKIEIGG